MKVPVRFLAFLLLSMSSLSWSLSPSPNQKSTRNSRREAMVRVLKAAAASVTVTPIAVVATPVKNNMENKLYNLSNDELAKIIQKDVQVNQFLASADLTREIYDESATFTDEIDTYKLDQWIKGTKRLFVANKSSVELVPDSIKVSDNEASFMFTEFLMFNLPVIKPTVYLSGKVILKRDLSTGLITSYQEVWDQDVAAVLRSAKF